MTNYVIILYKLSSNYPGRKESIKFRFSSDTYLLDNVKEMIIDAFRYEIEEITDNPDRVIEYREALDKLQRGLDFYRGLTDPFQIPDVDLTIDFINSIQHRPIESSFLMSEVRTGYDFEYFIGIEPYTGRELEFYIHY